MPPARATNRWLFGPTPDLLLGCGLGYLILFCAFLFAGPTLRTGQPGFLAPLLILLLSTPHYGATLVRIYERRAERRAYAFFTVWTTLALLALFVAGVGSTAVGTLLFTAYLTWSPWHYTGQNYGIAMLFLRRRGVSPTPPLRRALHASFVLSYALTFVVMHREDGTARALGEGGVHLARLGLPDALAGVLVPLLAVGWAAAIAATAAQVVRLGRVRDLLPVGLLMLSQAVWFVLPDLFRTWDAAGPVEALDHDFRATYFSWVVVAHAVQYLWITTYYAKANADWHGPLRYLAKTLLAGNVAWLVPALVFAPQLLGGSASELDVALVVAALVNLHHFILDGAIWKLRKSKIADVLVRARPAVEDDDVATRATGLRTRRAFWATAAALLAVALGEFTVREVAIPARARAGDLDGARTLLDALAWVGRDSATTRLALGRAFEDAGREGDALASYRRSAALTPTAEADAAVAALARRGDLSAAGEAAGASGAPR